jgi:hypothetical protein
MNIFTLIDSVPDAYKTPLSCKHDISPEGEKMLKYQLNTLIELQQDKT